MMPIRFEQKVTRDFHVIDLPKQNNKEKGTNPLKGPDKDEQIIGRSK